MTKQELIAFEDNIKELWEAGKIHCPHHFCGGNEEQLIEYFKRVKLDDWVFSTWRNSYHWLLKTGDIEFLRNKILVENNSMHIIDLERKFISTAIVGGNCGPAVGTAYAIKLKGGKNYVHCFVGDGGCDSGWFFETLRYAEGWELPITFVIEDNNRSVCTDVPTRWGKHSWRISEFVKMTNNYKLATRAAIECPSGRLYYYSYEPTYPHVGTGKWVNW